MGHEGRIKCVHLQDGTKVHKNPGLAQQRGLPETGLEKSGTSKPKEEESLSVCTVKSFGKTVAQK